MKTLILDVDTGEDDALAIIVAHALGLPLKYVVTSHGNTSLQNSTENSMRILSLIGAKEVSVIRGSSKPIEPHLHHTAGANANEFVGIDGLCGVKLAPAEGINLICPQEAEVGDLLADIIKSNAPCDYVITGPCTNFAKACAVLKDKVRDYVSNLVIMGCALNVPGNTGPIDAESKLQSAEFNVYCDPAAADLVLKLGAPAKLVCWDLTSTLTVAYEQTKELQPTNPAGAFTLELMHKFFHSAGFALGRNFELNDPIAVLAATKQGPFRATKVSICQDSTSYGKTSEDPLGAEVLVYEPDVAGKAELVSNVLRLVGVK